MVRLLIVFFSVFSFGYSFSQEVAFVIKEKGLILEGITHDSITNTFYLSSIFKNKIIEISEEGVRDFIASNSNGFVGGLGLHVDFSRRILWACSGNVMGNKFRTGIFAFNIDSKKLIKKIYFPTDTAKRLFNDLVIMRDGSICFTDTFGKYLWKWSLSMDEPQKIDLPVKLKFANGITASLENNILFVATSGGLIKVNTSDNKAEVLKMPESKFTSNDLDGIVFYKNSIIGVQNGGLKNSDMKIIRYYLADNYDKIEKVKIIDIGNKYFDTPTTLCLVNEDIYVIANSQLSNLDQKNLKIIALEKLNNTYILKYRLQE